MGLTADDLMGIIGAGASVWESDQKNKLAESNLITLANEAQATRDFTAVTEKNKQDYALKKEFLVDRREENEIAIANLVKEIGEWNVNASEWSTLDDDVRGKTEDGKSILHSLGLEYGEDFRFREQFANDSEVQLNNTQNLIGLQDRIIDDLTKKKNQILGLQEDWMKVGTEAGMKKIKDLSDIKSYMFENKEKFGIPLDMQIGDMDWAGSTNQLAKAFMKQKFSKTGKGFWMTPTQEELEQAGLSTEEGSYGMPVSEVLEKETRMNLNADFNTIQSTISDIKQEHQDKGKVYSEWLDELDLDNFLDLKGSEKLWDKDPMKLKTTIEGKILGMVNKSTKATKIESFFGTNYPEHENIRKLSGLVPATDITGTDIDESLSLLTAQPLNRYKGVNTLYERWLGGEIEQRNVDPRTGKETISYVGKTKVGGAPGIGASGLFNQEYAEDKMYHADYPSGEKFGTTAEDKLLYDLLSMWKKLDNYAPTYVPASLR